MLGFFISIKLVSIMIKEIQISYDKNFNVVVSFLYFMKIQVFNPCRILTLF
jgi:hypothetical protein